ncbi:MAG: hypothetical protein A3A33_00595 [Candidatus Yanofskybacteria bacterium RIFCSPLOWO2_01_FULL_49_25]|uniref:Uncharacterized protein n=1 Tax=Candidatus Yanofskybacteria bacterium RIFCSPLOWO2_01_FULL_49_25 TaxID=1802701 RepID=A0A1F8GTZ5_9BACT|nr:MAG: hypothetical protein A3A33_00595 [Candidatus Yanofskybacteria bacterium RIFCSPLOWO2_01_FULL_49_25]
MKLSVISKDSIIKRIRENILDKGNGELLLRPAKQAHRNTLVAHIVERKRTGRVTFKKLRNEAGAVGIRDNIVLETIIEITDRRPSRPLASAKLLS